MPTCPHCGAAIALPIPAALLPKLAAGLAARCALVGVVAERCDLDDGTPALALSRGAWTEVLPIRQAESLISALEAVMRPGAADNTRDGGRFGGAAHRHQEGA